jgi:uncharacterized protein (DUF697 family)
MKQKSEKKKPEPPEVQEKESDSVISRHVYSAMGVGLIPVPFFDFAGVAGIQLLLIRKLAKIYNVQFSTDIIKNMIGALIGGSAPVSGGQALSSMLKAVPLIGQTVGALSTSLLSGACTYALGKLFERHFIEGETFLSLDHGKAKKFYEDMFKEGMNIAAEIKEQKSKTA